MTLQIPNNHHLFSCTFSVPGSSRNSTVTCGGFTEFYDLPANILAQWLDALFSAGTRPFNIANLPTGYQRVYAKVLSREGGVLMSADSVVAVTGVGTTTPMPMNCATLVRKNTALAGRKFRGRMFAPPTYGESQVDAAGVILGTQITTLQTQWDAAYTALTTSNITPVLLHSDATAPTPITAFSISPLIGSIGRRLRR